MTDPGVCPHSRLDKTDATMTCRDCGWTSPRLANRQAWLEHIRNLIARTRGTAA